MRTLEQRADRLAAHAFRDAWTEASARYWTRRAERLEAARPRRGDFTGNSTPDDIVAVYDRLTAAAAACRARATGADGTAVLTLADTADALVPPTDDDLVDRLEPRLRAALDTGDSDEANRLAELIDALDGYVAPSTNQTEAAT